MSVLIVPRGLDDEYYKFLTMTVRANGDQLVIDRRTSERRRSATSIADNRRSGDRRGPLPVTWERDGLILLPDASPPHGGKH